jgi:hypothetical protein
MKMDLKCEKKFQNLKKSSPLTITFCIKYCMVIIRKMGYYLSTLAVSPKFKAKLYTDTLLSQVSHRKTANSRKHNN